jgi:hypothetical protein
MHFPEGYGLYRLLKNYQGTTLHAAEKLMFCNRARLYMLQKNSCFVTGHDFKAAEKPMFCNRARL